MGAQVWRIQRITHNDVEVVPVGASPGIIPFWRAEEQHRDFHFAEKIARIPRRGDRHLDEDGFIDDLSDRFLMETAAARELADFLGRQKVRTGARSAPQTPACRAFRRPASTPRRENR